MDLLIERVPNPVRLLQAIIVLACMVAPTHQSSPVSPALLRSTSATADDAVTLLSFKSLLSDPNLNLSSWSNQTAGDVCNWYGVMCSDAQRVTSLKLDSLGLAGRISPSIADLTSLQILNLAGNQFKESIPHELGNLLQLRYLNLSYNALSGGIPDTLSRCSKLKIISMDNNKLEGRLPVSLARCSKLQVICLTGNLFIGKIPDEFGLLSELSLLYLNNNKLSGAIPATLGASSSQLTSIMLSNNSLTGEIPDSIGNLFFLTQLVLQNNHLEGGIPPSLGKCLNLIEVDLRQNNLEGEIPQSLGYLTNLTYLDLSFNQLAGVIPASLYNLSLLSILNLGMNQLTGTILPDIGYTLSGLIYLSVQNNSLEGLIPPSLGNASELQYLDLSSNNFSGVIPANLGRLNNLIVLNLKGNRLKTRDAKDWSFLNYLSNSTNLKTLLLSNNDLAGEFPASVQNLSSQLKWLSLAGLQLSGEIPLEIRKLHGLEQLDLSHNNLTGKIPSTIGFLSNLTRLYLFGNKLSGPIPDSLANLNKLEVLHLGDNHLQGSIPSNFMGFKLLNELNLSYNQLNGTISREILSISSLSKVFDLSHNFFFGSIPRDIEKLNLLVLLDVSENKLSGEIPIGLSSCQTLNELYMEGNSFEGSIPSQLSNLKSLQRFDISRNKLSGQIPEFFTAMTSLQYLNLSFNDFDGPVPEEGVFANTSEVFVNGNPKLCRGSPALRLPSCSIHSSKSSGSLRIVSLAIGSLAFCLVVMSTIIVLRKKVLSKRLSVTSSSRDQFLKVSYAELHKATNGFSSANLIGTGSFSSVYKGTLDGYQKCVAVKVLNLGQTGALKSYMAECEALRSIRHRNLVKILTCCSTIDHSGNDFKALVFEFVPNRSLEDWLHRKMHSGIDMKHLSLAQRLDIAIDVASALEYLHHRHGQTAIVHCDVKPSNILLSNDMCAQLGDFGLAKFIGRSMFAANGYPSYSIALKGSIGYIPPEYGIGGDVSTTGDVYSYGILVLEMVTGKRPTDEMFDDSQSLRSFVEKAFLERITEVVVPAMLSNTEDGDERRRAVRCLTSMIEIGLMCSKEAPHARMDMESIHGKMVAIRNAYHEFGNGGICDGV
ncbi:receptor kinase-like protein Xa21 [Canna indica]|uniref:Receptor kinase-like protein Xa21 n=1 Tax=Canna indica TaxID=4628 RepID=A0AAQ3QEJ8_9LILI|nr:receptor kinase-like protein Xa21 [Canna indica]